MEQKKSEALNNYKSAKEAYMKNATPENWRTFCEAKRVCRLLGVRI